MVLAGFKPGNKTIYDIYGKTLFFWLFLLFAFGCEHGQHSSAFHFWHVLQHARFRETLRKFEK
jgi:hypothetical protein